MRDERTPTRLAGAVLGVCIAVAAIVLALPSGGRGGVLPATLDVAVRTGGAIAATPAAPNVVLHAGELRPGNGAEAADFDLDNESGRPLTVSFSAAASSTALDGLVRVAIRSAGKEALEANVGELQAGDLGSLVLRPGERRSLRVAAWIPGEVETGYEGRRVRLELVPAAASGRSR